MARIKLGPLITDISGSIGMATIQRNRFGHTLRLKPLPKKSQTPAQYTIRQHILTIQHAWHELTDAERLQWDRFINFSGQTIKKDKSVLLSGYQLYLKYQLFHLMQNWPIFTGITYIPMPDFAPFDALTLEEGIFYASFSGAVLYEIYNFILKLSSPRPENQAFSPRGLRYIMCIINAAGPFPINQFYIEAFGAIPPIGSFIHCSIQYYSLLSPVYSGKITSVIEVTEP